MTATNTDFINQILSSTVRLCDKGVEGCRVCLNMLMPHGRNVGAGRVSYNYIKLVLKFFAVLSCPCIIPMYSCPT